MHHLDPSRPDSSRAVRHRRARALGVAAVALGAVLVPANAGFGQAGPHDPPGNNGTVKIDGAPWDDHPDNEPHPGCTFQVDFYGYDAGVGDAQVVFALQAPTTDGTLQVLSGDLTPNIGEDAAGGGTDLDASETYQLGFTGAAAKQGYHVKLTVHAPGSIGADTKHKVFWVSGCDAPTPTTTTTSPTTTTTFVVTPEDTPVEGPLVEGAEENAGPAAVQAAGAEAAAAAPAAPAPAATAVQGTPALTG